jgi:hypothetical protein
MPKPSRTHRSITLGRGSDNTIVLNGPNISTHHARLILSERGIILEDLGSTNGTSVGTVENKISRARVRKTDTVFLGSTAYKVSALLKQLSPAPTVTVQSVPPPLPAQSELLIRKSLLFGGLGLAAVCAVASWMVNSNLTSRDEQLVTSATDSESIISINESATSEGEAILAESEVDAVTADPESGISTPSTDIVQRSPPSDSSDQRLANQGSSETAQPIQAAKSAGDAAAEDSTPNLRNIKEASSPDFRMWRVSSPGITNVVFSAKMIEYKSDTVRLQKQDGTEISATFDRLGPQDLDYLRGILWAGKEEMPFHTALEQGLIVAKTGDYSHDRLTLGIASKGCVITPRIQVPGGTWIELDQHPNAGRIYLATGKRATSMKIDDWDRKESTFYGADGFTAIPATSAAKVPVIETAEVAPLKIRPLNHSSISRAGFDPVAAEFLAAETRMNAKDEILSKTAALWLMDKPDLDLEKFQTSATRTFTERVTISDKRNMNFLGNKAPNMLRRKTQMKTWNATEEHLKMGEHLLEKAKFDPQSVPDAEATSREKPSLPGTMSLVDALDSGLATASGRKGLNGRLIVKLTRTAQAPAGPLHVNVPIGTVLSVDDGKPEPMQVYALYDERIDLFGQVSGGAQVPVLYGSYKRKIKTTMELEVTATFDPAIAELFRNRPDEHYAQMAVEAVLLDRDDLDRDQIQYHLSLVGVPATEDATAVTEELIEVAKRRIAGDKTEFLAVASKQSTSDSPSSSSTSSAMKNEPASQAAAPVDSPAQASTTDRDLIELSNMSPDEKERARKLLDEMNKYLPDSPEEDIIGTWVTVSEAEAREIAEQIRLSFYKQIAITQSKTLSEDELRQLEQQVRAELRGLRVVSGSVSFEIDEKGLKRYNGKLSNRQPRVTMNLGGNWSLDGNGFILSPSGGVHFTVERLTYVADGRLAQLGQFPGGRITYGIVVLKKQE